METPEETEEPPAATEATSNPPAAPALGDAPVASPSPAAEEELKTPLSAMGNYLKDSVGLKDDVAQAAAKHMEDEYEIEKHEDLKHLSKSDIDAIVEKTGMKKVSAGKLLDAWEALQGGGAEAPPAATSPALASASPRKKGFLPGYSDAAEDAASMRRGLRLMYLSEEGATGKRELVVDEEKTQDLFEAMSGDALLITVFGPARCGKSFLMVGACPCNTAHYCPHFVTSPHLLHLGFPV